MNGYALDQLGRAFTTAASHEDQETRRRAGRRAAAWGRTLAGLASGRVRLGSRAPVADLPAWVTLEVLRGGFATGSALAEGDLEPDETALAERLGVLTDRRALFAYHLSDAGLAELFDLLDRRAYRVVLPEDAALLVVAWLVRHGHRTAALDLLDELEPLAGRLRFTPRRTTAASVPPDHVFRLSAGEARRVLESRRPHAQVEAQREALTVWNPFADRMLGLWRSRLADGWVDLAVPEEWRVEAGRLVEEYDLLAARHTWCTKHRDPKENLAVLVAVARDVVLGRPVHARRAGLLAAAVAAMVVKRGEPGSSARASRRALEGAAARLPVHAVLARTAAAPHDGAEPLVGLEHPEAYGGPVSAAEAADGPPEGAPMPPVVERTLDRARSAPVEALIESGVVPSSEVLAGLVPAISAGVVAEGYGDEALGRLMGLTYTAFRRRRSLLLVDLAKQVQLGELPWVRAVDAFRTGDVDERLAVARRVGALALDHFPGTLLPNPLVRELDHLLQGTAVDVPLTEELAADIFVGRFSAKFARAADVAAGLLVGSLYERYYDLDRRPSRAPHPAEPGPRWLVRLRPSQPEADAFTALCFQRAGRNLDVGHSVAANGTVIEQAQIVTTHNLAALVAAGVTPSRPWLDLADAALAHAWALLELARTKERALSTVKDAAYAWRQAIFYASLAPSDAVAAWVPTLTPPKAAPVAGQSLLGGLRHVAAGGRFDDDGRCPGGRRFLGWTTGRAWVLDERSGRFAEARDD